MQTFNLSIFNHKRDTVPKMAEQSWQQLCSNFQKPQVRREKDGLLFSPAFFKPARRLKENVSEVSMLVLDIDHNAEFETLRRQLAALDSAFAVYSTHSHLRQTETNPKAEPRFRAIIPLAVAIPAKDFPALWQYVKRLTGLPMDESAKDVSRMFYTPAIAAKDAPYDFYIADGEPLDWRALQLDDFHLGESQKGNGHKDNQTANAALCFEFDEDRHAELVRRFKGRAKRNSRGRYDAQARCHNGNGNTGAFYDPETNHVVCNKKPDKCDYKAILRGEGLPDNPLPSREYAEKRQVAEQETEKPLQIIRASEVTPKSVSWLWYPYIPLNYVTLFSGEEGVGKSWIFCAIASGITNGFLPLLAELFEPQNVLIFSAEDSADDALVPRLIRTGANLERVSIVNERFTFDEKGLLRFEHYIAETEPVWVIIDPLFAYSDLRLDLNRPHHARYVATSIERIAKKYGIAVSYLIHFNKSKGAGDARAAVSSSQEFSNAARSILLIGKDPNDDTRRALIHRKHNYSPKGKAIGYQITGGADGAEFLWLGESTLTEREIVDRAGNAEERGEQSEAVAFLQNVLANGRRKVSDVIKEAEKLDISKHKLRTARAKLGIQPYSEGFAEKTWFWELPKTPVAEDAKPGVDAPVDACQNENSHLRANHSDKTSYDNDLPEDASSANYTHLRGASTTNSHLRDGDYFMPAGTEI
jgi:DNA repair protein RadA/Sms